MSESVNTSVPESEIDLKALEVQLLSGTEKNQLQAIAALAAAGVAGESVLGTFLCQRQSEAVVPTFVEGLCYEQLLRSTAPESQMFLQQHFPTGIVPLTSEANIDYKPLQRLLADHHFLEADRVTLQKLCELAGPAAMKRKWLYFSEVEGFPAMDLLTLNRLWQVHSEGKFGFSVQRQIWLSVGRNWEVLWPKIQWKAGKTWTRYPDEFVWDLSAPRGHLPLSNQLRGVQTMNALLSHPAWTL
ncbi:MAG: GUN4 N-terminal ARM-like repeat domain-containing protein [Thermosynechococcaceae cyanobacterium]